mgnify:CR=1 FL=1
MPALLTTFDEATVEGASIFVKGLPHNGSRVGIGRSDTGQRRQAKGCMDEQRMVVIGMGSKEGKEGGGYLRRGGLRVQPPGSIMEEFTFLSLDETTVRNEDEGTREEDQLEILPVPSVFVPVCAAMDQTAWWTFTICFQNRTRRAGNTSASQTSTAQTVASMENQLLRPGAFLNANVL